MLELSASKKFIPPTEARSATPLSTEFVSDERATRDVTRVEFLFDCLIQSGT